MPVAARHARFDCVTNEAETEVARGGSYPLARRAVTALFGANTARAMGDRLVDYRVWREQTFTSAGRANRARIQRFKDIHAGGRCVIIGNGPSLRDTDLGLLRNEVTFGLNRIYLMFEELGFETTYLAAVNTFVVEQCSEDLRQVSAPLFTWASNRKYLAGLPSATYLTELSGPRFVSNVANGAWAGGTVTYVAMQLAYYMGFSEVVLVGVDHRFASKGPANKLVVSTEPDKSHFDPRYFGPGFKWQLPDLETSEIAYKLARRKFEANGRRIVDATVGGALEIFPKMSLSTALGK